MSSLADHHNSCSLRTQFNLSCLTGCSFRYSGGTENIVECEFPPFHGRRIRQHDKLNAEQQTIELYYKTERNITELYKHVTIITKTVYIVSANGKLPVINAKFA